MWSASPARTSPPSSRRPRCRASFTSKAVREWKNFQKAVIAEYESLHKIVQKKTQEKHNTSLHKKKKKSTEDVNKLNDKERKKNATKPILDKIKSTHKNVSGIKGYGDE